MGGADDRSAANEELARRIVQPTSRVRADVVVRPCLVAVAVDQQGFRLALDEGLGFAIREGRRTVGAGTVTALLG